MSIQSAYASLHEYLNNKLIPEINALDPDETLQRPEIIKDAWITTEAKLYVDITQLDTIIDYGDNIAGCGGQLVHVYEIWLNCSNENEIMTRNILNLWADALIKIIKGDPTLGKKVADTRIDPSINYGDANRADTEKKLSRGIFATLEVRDV